MGRITPCCHPNCEEKFLTTQRTDKAARASIHHRILGKWKSALRKLLAPTAASLYGS